METNYSHNLTILKSLHDGDLVEFPRGIYSHWAVYIGKGKVVHLAGEDNDGIDGDVRPKHSFTVCGKQFNKAKVCIDDFWDVVEDCKAQKNNDKDKNWGAMHPREVVRNALSKVGEVGYNAIYLNCEHFAKWCRYGIEKSDQADNFVTGAAVVGAAGVVLGGACLISKLWGKEEAEDEKEKKTRVVKLP